MKRIKEAQVLLNGEISKEQVCRERVRFRSRNRRPRVLAEKLEAREKGEENYSHDRRDY